MSNNDLLADLESLSGNESETESNLIIHPVTGLQTENNREEKLYQLVKKFNSEDCKQTLQVLLI